MEGRSALIIQTVSLKLHHPSAGKIAVMDQAFARFGAGTRQLLAAARPEAEQIPIADKAAQWDFINRFLTRREVINQLNLLSAQPFKDAIKRHLAATLNRWFARRSIHPDAAYPEIRRPDHQVAFCRYSSNRDYCLLFDRQKQRYYAKLHLLCRDDPPFAMPEQIIPTRFSMIGGDLLLTSAAPRYMLIPLSFGKRQLQLLEAARQGAVRPKTAWLIRKNGDYFLNVSLEIPIPKTKDTLRYFGLTRGLQSSLAAAVCDQKGELVAEETFAGPNRNCAGNRAEELHKLANRIVRSVAKHESQLVMENLLFCNDRLACDGLEPAMTVHDYMALKDMLQYKLPLAGWPPPVPVSPARLFCTCPRCGHAANNNRLNAEIFLCINCGFGSPTDAAGSLNLARRMKKYSSSRIIFQEKSLDSGFEYSNKRFGLSVQLGSRQEFEKYLASLTKATRYDHRQAALIRKLGASPDLLDNIEIIAED